MFLGKYCLMGLLGIMGCASALPTLAQTAAPSASSVRVGAPDGKRPVWILSPKTAKELREQSWRNRMSMQFVEPTIGEMGEPTFRKIGVNCFEPSVTIQYMDNRRLYSTVYIKDYVGWREGGSAGFRSLPVELEPSEVDLDGYLQRSCGITPEIE